MITEKRTASKKIRRLKEEAKRLKAELNILEKAGSAAFPISIELLRTKVLHIEGTIIGIRWFINTNEKEGKKVVKKNTPAPQPAPTKKEVVKTPEKKKAVTKKAKMEVKK